MNCVQTRRFTAADLIWQSLCWDSSREMEAGARGGLDKVREKRFLRLLFSFSVLFSCFFIFSELLVAA